MQDARITKERIRNHFTYGWWKYAVLVVAAILGWNLFYTTTAYRAPKDKRLDLYFVTYGLPETVTDWFSQQVLALFPELEDSMCASISYMDDDNYYGSMQLSTYVGAAEGDIYIMTRERFDAFKGMGVFVNLDDAVASGVIDVRGMDVSRGIATTEEGDRGLYGIPAEPLYGLMEQFGIDNRDLMLCVMAYSENQHIAIQFVDWMVGEMMAPKPDWLAEQEATKVESSGGQEISDIPSY